MRYIISPKGLIYFNKELKFMGFYIYFVWKKNDRDQHPE